eukprot:m.16981 g.16981  ORF g.16981 m.16981 type:complete len:489 (+) comp27256_c0_seq1:723-2189(+)
MTESLEKCELCSRTFNGPDHAKAHYSGKKHRKKLETTGAASQATAISSESSSQTSLFPKKCSMCPEVELTSDKMEEEHLKGKGHQSRLEQSKSERKTASGSVDRDKFSVAPPHRTPSSADPQPVDLCIVTAVDIEFDAAKKVLENATKSEMRLKTCHAEGGGEFQIWETEWPNFFSDEGSRPLNIALLKQTKMGREEAGRTIVNILTSRLKTAKVVAMTGICGGASDKVKLGDLLVPEKIVRKAGKEKRGGEFKGDADPVPLDSILKGKVDGVKSGYTWKSYIPVDKQDLPSPAVLQDTILDKVRTLYNSGMRASTKKILKEIRKIWNQQKVDDTDVEEALEKLEQSKMLVNMEGDFRILREGETRADNIDRHYKKSSKELKDPVVHTETLLTIDVVSEDLNFEQFREDLQQRKIFGVEMEGYAFLFYANAFLKGAKAILIKGISDLASENTKMDYYQPFCAASSTAFLCHLIKTYGKDLFEHGQPPF